MAKSYKIFCRLLAPSIHKQTPNALVALALCRCMKRERYACPAAGVGARGMAQER